MKNYHALSLRVQAISVLKNARTTAPIAQICAVIDALDHSVTTFAQAYGALCTVQLGQGAMASNLTRTLQCDINPLTDALHAKQKPTANLMAAVDFDLAVLGDLLLLSGADLIAMACQVFPEDASILHTFPTFVGGCALPISTANDLLALYRKNGYGFFAQAIFFAVTPEENIEAVSPPDPIRLADLKGYTLQKDKIIANTRSFMANRQCNNILLYGDKGTGKSSSIKAVVNEYANKGLRIVQLSTHQIHLFPMVFKQIAACPFHVVLFLDDLSFESEDLNFATLKAFIEGGLTGKPDNLVIYATTNRRHLVRESFSARQGDDVHVRDTLESISSLSARFGLEITFSVPDKDEYLYIVGVLAEESGIEMPIERLHLLAERFAIRRNGRSPRTARQFISSLLTEQA